MLRKLIGSLSLAVLFGVSTFGQPIPPGALASSKPVFMGGKQVATTGVNGDLVYALDSTKNYVVLHRDCNRYEIVQTPSAEEQACEKDSSRNQNGCQQCEVAGWITGGQWKPASSSGAADAPGTGFGLAFDVGVGANFGTLTKLGDGVTAIQQELTGLRYTSTGGESDTASTGVAVSGGVGFAFEPMTPRIGISYQQYGDLPSRAFGSRTNVTGSPSNLVFTSETITSLKVFGVDVGVVIPMGDRFFVSPNVNLGWGTFQTTNSQQLQAGPVGPNPASTVVNTDSQSFSETKFGLGWSAEAGYCFSNWFAVTGGYSWRFFNDVFAQPDVARRPGDQTLRLLWLGVKLQKGY